MYRLRNDGGMHCTERCVCIGKSLFLFARTLFNLKFKVAINDCMLLMFLPLPLNRWIMLLRLRYSFFCILFSPMKNVDPTTLLTHSFSIILFVITCTSLHKYTRIGIGNENCRRWDLWSKPLHTHKKFWISNSNRTTLTARYISNNTCYHWWYT